VILAWVGQKGGGGKTTLALCVASELVQRGAKVLLVDADPQGSVVTWRDVAQEAGLVTPSVVAVSGAFHSDSQVPTLSKAYDYTIIDTPGRHDKAQRSALLGADIALVPCSAAGVETWALGATVEVIADAKDFNPKLAVALVINKKRPRVKVSKDVRGVLESTGLDVLQSEIGFRQAFQDAIACGMGVRQFEPRGAAAEEISVLVTEIVKMGKR
jgi:chromosome partitioning protein